MCKCTRIAKADVEDILFRILHQDSRGDMAQEIKKITKEFGLTLPEQQAESDSDNSSDDGNY